MCSSRRVKVDNDTLVEGRLPPSRREMGEESHACSTWGSDATEVTVIVYGCISIGFQLSEWSKHSCTMVEDY